MRNSDAVLECGDGLRKSARGQAQSTTLARRRENLCDLAGQHYYGDLD
jgi:hypothetical protein